MEKQTKIIIATIASIVALVSIGGCAMTQKESNKQDKKVVSSKKFIKDDKEAIKQKQLTYLKEHEQEIINFVKSQSPKVETVQIDWGSMRVGQSGNGTPQGGGYNLAISGKVNNLDNTKFSVDFYIEHQDSIPNTGEMGMLHDIYINENGGWRIFS
ncbi:hypothetical protein ACVRXQ_02675 [Streptococcus panodentis]|uniref:Lipoprotein n=1 Tax=Streptococcus panodentis TaxID=1581472 RepID=A0ABS5AZW4_9STRE|nr:hypothetical protein [Streptococcus panodentis]MBP2621806.1 hypothetical protein [Streptococcus panodentis]